MRLVGQLKGKSKEKTKLDSHNSSEQLLEDSFLSAITIFALRKWMKPDSTLKPNFIVTEKGSVITDLLQAKRIKWTVQQFQLRNRLGDNISP